MNPNFSQLSPDERAQRLTALIFGELPAEEAEQILQAIAADAELAREYERRKQTIELVRETAAMDRKVSAGGTPLKLDGERRQKLLERFKTPAPRAAVPRRPRNLWYVPMSLAAALVGLLVAAVTLPKLSKAKARAERGYTFGRTARLSAVGNQSEFAGEPAEGLKPQWRMLDPARLPAEAPALKSPSADSRRSTLGLNVALPAAVDGDGRVQITGLTDFGAERMLVNKLGEQPIDKSLRAGIKLEVAKELDHVNDSFAIAVDPSSEGLGVTKGIANHLTPPSGPPPVLGEQIFITDYAFAAGSSDSTRATAEVATTWSAPTTNSFTVPPSPGVALSYSFSELQNHSAATPPGGFPATAPVPGQAPLALGGSVFSMDAIGYANVKRESTANESASPSKPSDFVDLYANGAIALGDKEVAATTRQNGQQAVALYDNDYDDYDQAAVAAQIQRAGAGGTAYAGAGIAGRGNNTGQAVGGGVFGGSSAQSRMDGSSVASGGFGGGGRGSFGNRLGGASQVAAGRSDGSDRPQTSPANAATTRGFYDDNVDTWADPTKAAGDMNGRSGIQLPRLESETRFNRESSPTRGGEESKAVAGPRSYAAESLQGLDAAGLPVEAKDSKAIRDAIPLAGPRRAEAGTLALLPAIPAQSDGDNGGPVAFDRIEDQTYQKNKVQPEAELRGPSQTEPKLLKEQLAQIVETKKTDGPTVLSQNVSLSTPLRDAPAPTPQFQPRASGVSTLDGSVHQTPSQRSANGGIAIQLPELATEAQLSRQSTPMRPIRQAEVEVSQLLDSYAELTGRTLMKSPALSTSGRISVPDQTQLTKEEKIKTLQESLALAGVTLVPEGDKLIKSVPSASFPAEAAPDPNALLAKQPQTRSKQVVQAAETNIVTFDSVVPERPAPAKLVTAAPTPQPEVLTRDNAFSTFSLNVSDVSFKLAAASLEKGALPEVASLRSEEFLNAFDYRDPMPAAGVPIAFAWERARYPFAHNRDALRFSVKTAAQGREAGKPLNIVLLLDNSGSMERADRVRIIQESLRSLAAQLQPQDKLSVVTFARTPRLWADGVTGAQAAEVAKQIGALTPEGGTNLEDALDLAYRTALRHYAATAVNRVVLLTDGAANLGNVEPKTLKAKVEGFRKQGVALDCFGIGWDGFNDDLLEQLSRNGDGRYGFVNTPEEAATEFVGQLAGALRVAASDVKVQVEFNPRRVTAYRQIGYAKHQLTKQQFRDNTVDAAEIGAAEAGNGLYIIETNPRGEGPIATVRARFRIPQTSDYREHEWVVPFGSTVELEQSSTALRLATSASAFSEWIAGSPFAGDVTTDRLLGILSGVPEVYGADPRPKKLEWMIRQAKSISGK